MSQVTDSTGNVFAARRAFLKRAGLATLALVPASAVLASTPERRSLAFLHTHTRERLSAVYYESGRYLATALTQVNQLLRDFRTEAVYPIDPRLLDQLFMLQSLAGSDQAFEVISGFRSPATNTSLRRRSGGVAEHSLHMEGRAIDVRLPGRSTQQLVVLARQQQWGGVGFYRQSDFVHLDTGRVRNWGDPIRL
jgi:uncharacterized protein YcbK (DUF882 family)